MGVRMLLVGLLVRGVGFADRPRVCALSSALIQVCIKTCAWSRLNNFAHFRQICWACARLRFAIGTKRLLRAVWCFFSAE